MYPKKANKPLVGFPSFDLTTDLFKKKKKFNDPVQIFVLLHAYVYTAGDPFFCIYKRVCRDIPKCCCETI